MREKIERAELLGARREAMLHLRRRNSGKSITVDYLRRRIVALDQRLNPTRGR